MAKAPDLLNQKFGRLTVISRAPNYHAGRHTELAMWNCVCECGNKTTVRAGTLRNGNTKSCGCLRGGQFKNRNGSILTMDIVREIRRAYANKEMNQTALGIKYSLSQPHISNIILNKFWAEVV